MSKPVFLQPENVMAQEVEDELVLLHLDSELYIALDAVAKRFWTLALSEESVSDILDTLESEYEVTRDTVRHDFQIFIQELERNNLIAKASIDN